MASDPLTYSSRPRRRLSSLVLLVLLAFGAGIAVTVALVRYYARWATPTTAQRSSGNAGGSIGGIFQPPPEADSTPRTPDALVLEARLNALAGKLAALEAREATIDRDSQAAAGNAGRAEALFVALAARRTIDKGQPLGELENQLRARFGASQGRAVAIIIAGAKQPVTLETLRLQLDTLAPLLISGATSEGWWPSLRREITGLITIRKQGTPPPRPASRLAEMRRLIDAGNVDAALANVAALPGAADANGWRAEAARYVEVHRALDAIETAALSAPPPPPPPASVPAPSPSAPAARPAPAAPAVPTGGSIVPR